MRNLVLKRLRFVFGVVIIFLAFSGETGPAQTVDARPPAQIAVSPSIFELSIGSKPTAGSMRVFNLGKESVDVKISVSSWVLDEKNQVQIIEPDEQSLEQWIVINPLRFEIPAGRSQTVRFSIRPRVKPLPGEHRAIIYLDQVLPEQEKRKLRVRFRFGVGVYGYVGAIVRIGRLHSVSVDATSKLVKAFFDISSEGNAHVRMRGQYTIWPAQNYPGTENTSMITDLNGTGAQIPSAVLCVGDLPTKPVLPGYRRTIELAIGTELPPGDYILDLNATLEQTTIDRAVPFTVSEKPN